MTFSVYCIGRTRKKCQLLDSVDHLSLFFFVSSVRLGSVVWHLLVQTSYIQKDPLDGTASFFRWPCYRSKISPGDEPGEQMASTEDPRKGKIILLLAGIEPGSPSCESDVLPLDHGLPLHLLLFCQLLESGWARINWIQAVDKFCVEQLISCSVDQLFVKQSNFEQFTPHSSTTLMS